MGNEYLAVTLVLQILGKAGSFYIATLYPSPPRRILHFHLFNNLKDLSLTMNTFVFNFYIFYVKQTAL